MAFSRGRMPSANAARASRLVSRIALAALRAANAATAVDVAPMSVPSAATHVAIAAAFSQPLRPDSPTVTRTGVVAASTTSTRTEATVAIGLPTAKTTVPGSRRRRPHPA